MIYDYASISVEIENCFAKVHPQVGNHSIAATGEGYISYGIATPCYEESVNMLVNTFRILGACCAPSKPEGAPIMIDRLRKKYLYWRLKPVIQEIRDTTTWEGIPKGYWVAYCRALVSERWAEEGQLL